MTSIGCHYTAMSGRVWNPRHLISSISVACCSQCWELAPVPRSETGKDTPTSDSRSHYEGPATFRQDRKLFILAGLSGLELFSLSSYPVVGRRRCSSRRCRLSRSGCWCCGEGGAPTPPRRPPAHAAYSSHYRHHRQVTNSCTSRQHCPCHSRNTSFKDNFSISSVLLKRHVLISGCFIKISVEVRRPQILARMK